MFASLFGATEARIARLERVTQAQAETIARLCARLGEEPPAVDPRATLSPEEEALVRAGQPILAVKRHRERTGSSLVEAKSAVDRVR